MTNKEFTNKIYEKLDEIKKLFDAKNEQYSTSDPLANFSSGALLMYGDDHIGYKFEALKAYAAKHIAFVYGHRLFENKVDESIKDIVVYFIIASVLSDVQKEGKARNGR